MFRLATSSAKTQLNIGTTMKVKVKKSLEFSILCLDPHLGGGSKK